VIYRRRRGNFIVTDVFVIHKSGLLIKYRGDTLGQDSDEDIISGMLSAVQMFISESFAQNTKKVNDDWKLNQLRMGGHEIMIERGDFVFIAIIYEGTPGKRLTKLLSDLVSLIEFKYGSVLKNWSGNHSKLKGIENDIIKILTVKPKMPESKSSKPDTRKQIDLQSTKKPNQLLGFSSSQTPAKPQQLPPSQNTVQTKLIQPPLLPPKQSSSNHTIKQSSPTELSRKLNAPTQQVLTTTPIHISNKIPQKIINKKK
jgi:hypothetical protein